MKKCLQIISLIIFVHDIALCQRIKTNTFIRDVDEPFQFNNELVKSNYRVIKIYHCPDSIFKKSICRCKSKELYNDTGRIVKLISGNDIENNQVNYIVNYVSANDSFCQVVSEYMSHYIDSLSLFMYDTIIHKKNKIVDTYTREQNNNLKIKSILFYQTRNILPDKILRYDKMGQLKEIDYPLGNRTTLKRWSDSAVTRDTRTIYLHTIYPENAYHEYTKYAKGGVILEDGYTNISNDSTLTSQQTIYIYDDSSRLVFKHTVDEKNIFVQSESYIYQDGILINYRLDRNLNDPIDNEIKKFNKKSQLLELFKKQSVYPYDTWKWNYIFKENLQQRTDYFRNDKYQSSDFFIYEVPD